MDIIADAFVPLNVLLPPLIIVELPVPVFAVARHPAAPVEAANPEAAEVEAG